MVVRDYILECELYASLSHVHVAVVGEEVLLQTVVGVVKHAEDVAVEAVVQTDSVAVCLTAADAG